MATLYAAPAFTPLPGAGANFDLWGVAEKRRKKKKEKKEKKKEKKEKRRFFH